MKKEEVNALFLLACIPVKGLFEIKNKYWPDHPDYDRVRNENPWWLVNTGKGMIEIGWRKHVISIDWKDVGVEVIVTKDDVTKDNHLVHAWGYSKALEYLTNLRLAAF